EEVSSRGETDEGAWDEALGRGLLGTLGLVRARDGALRLTAATGRFVDGAPPRVQLVAGGPGAAELPAGNTRVDGGPVPVGVVAAVAVALVIGFLAMRATHPPEPEPHPAAAADAATATTTTPTPPGRGDLGGGATATPPRVILSAAWGAGAGQLGHRA